MTIGNSSQEDLHGILSLFDVARSYQKAKGAVLWPVFDQALIQTEIAKKRQWKIIIDNQLACVWATTFSDPQIWEERNSHPSIYIHRIATNPIFRGRNLVGEIVRTTYKRSN